jgi:RND family efflux transporter MFP subunit
MFSQHFRSLSTAVASIVLPALALSGCGRGNGAQPAGAGAPAPPPSAVTTLKLTPTKIEDASEFIATLRSLQSTTVQPQVEGLVKRIFVKSGDKVSVGTPILQIDEARQQAAVASTEANRAGTEADAIYWRAQTQRMETLVAAGAVSKAEFDQAQNSLRSAEARLAALDAQLREGRVELQYYRLTAPQSGTIGDISVRVGDRVTTSTEITTIDDGQALEAYIQVPLDRSPHIKLGLPVQLLDDTGKVLLTNPITFVAPRVDDATQTVLVKTQLRNPPPNARVLQFIRSRIVWRSVDGLTIPLTSVVRISGQYFCFTAEPGPQGGLVARQKPITVGPLVGNDYVVLGGLKPGETIIVNGIQKIGDGAPISAEGGR